jgi:hypothetical protein
VQPGTKSFQFDFVANSLARCEAAQPVGARIHQTLRVTPAMEAGIADHVWSLEEMVELLETSRVKAA